MSNKRNEFFNLDSYIRRMLLYYSIIGYFPDGWKNTDFAAYISEKNYAMRIILLYLGDRKTEQNKRNEIITSIEHTFSVLNVQLYDKYMLGLMFENRSVPSDYPAYVQAKLPAFFPTAKKPPQILISEAILSVEQLPVIYRGLYAKLPLQDDSAPRRYNHLMSLYSLEDELYNKIIEGDSDAIRHLMNAIAELVDLVDLGRHDNCWGYFSFLWRNIERIIFFRTGRRKTSTNKLMLDQDLAACQTAAEMADVVYRFILSYSFDLQLQDHIHYHKIIERVKDYINEYYSEKVSLDKVSQEMGFSVSYLSRLFKRETGISFKDYVIQVRMNHAKHLLNVGKLNINEVAAATGYSDVGYFCHAFKRYWHATPRHFRSKS